MDAVEIVGGPLDGAQILLSDVPNGYTVVEHRENHGLYALHPGFAQWFTRSFS